MDSTTITYIISVIISAVVAFAITSFRLGKYTEKIEQLEKHNLHGRISCLEGKVETSQDLSKFIKTKSPFALTEEGKKLLEDSGGKLYIEQNKEELIKQIGAKNPNSAYDVQEYAKAVITEKSSDESFKEIKDYLFKNGLTLDLIVGVMGISLRDIALPEFPSFSITDIKD